MINYNYNIKSQDPPTPIIEISCEENKYISKNIFYDDPEKMFSRPQSIDNIAKDVYLQIQSNKQNAKQ